MCVYVWVSVKVSYNDILLEPFLVLKMWLKETRMICYIHHAYMCIYIRAYTHCLDFKVISPHLYGFHMMS